MRKGLTNPARAAPCAVVGAEDGDDEVQRLRSDAAPAWATGNDGGGGRCRRCRTQGTTGPDPDRIWEGVGSGDVGGEGVVRGLGFLGGSG